MELLESILSRVNMQRAFKQVMRNKGSGGVDGVEIEGFSSKCREPVGTEIRSLGGGGTESEYRITTVDTGYMRS